MDRQSTEIELARADSSAAPPARRWPLRKFFDRRFTAVQESLAAHISAEAHDTRTHLSALSSDHHVIELREEAMRIDDLRRYVAAGRDANIDAATFVGEVLRDLEERLAELQDDVRGSSRRAPSTADELDLDDRH